MKRACIGKPLSNERYTFSNGDNEEIPWCAKCLRDYNTDKVIAFTLSEAFTEVLSYIACIKGYSIVEITN